ncbi:hypothetical protein QQP08_025676, partial [Theobroma cacao]
MLPCTRREARFSSEDLHQLSSFPTHPKTLGPTTNEDFRRFGSGKDLPPMDLRSMLTSSDSTKSATKQVPTSSDKAVCITMRALTWSQSPKHQPLAPRASTTASVEAEVVLSSIFGSLAPLILRRRVIKRGRFVSDMKKNLNRPIR